MAAFEMNAETGRSDHGQLSRLQRRTMQQLFSELRDCINGTDAEENFGQFRRQFRGAMGNGALTRQEFQTTLDTLEDMIQQAGATPREERRLYQRLHDVSALSGLPSAVMIPEEQRENIRTLITDVKESVDVRPTREALQGLTTTIYDAFSDRTLTESELIEIVGEAVDLVVSTGVTAEEARTIFYDLQDIAETSELSSTDDNLVGTDGDDLLWAGLGNDTLAGTPATGTDEVDWLIGGGGNDTFVLGDASARWYDDGTVAPGLADYAAILDFNIDQDIIQLKGNASQYTLGAIPDGIEITGTALYDNNSSNPSTPELVGVIVGVTVTDFSAGFSFV